MDRQVTILKGYFAILNPRNWLPMAQRIRKSEGSNPPMMLFAALLALGFGSHLWQSSIVVAACVYTLLICMSIVGLVASLLALSDSFRNLNRFSLSAFRFSLSAFYRPRFWFEFARFACIAGAIVSFVLLPIAFIAFAESTLFSVVLSGLMLPSFLLFFGASTLGYFQSLVSGRRVSGRAKQCVDFFYPLSLAEIAVIAYLFLTIKKFANPLIPVYALVAICLVGAVAITISKRRNLGLWKFRRSQIPLEAGYVE